MRRFFVLIDRLLRGDFTRGGDPAAVQAVSLGSLIRAGFAMGAIYGVFMGLYAVARPDHRSVAQFLATTAKVPLLFLLTLFVTFPSLYVFSALANSRARFLETLRLLLAVLAVTLAVLASFGPITGFFTLSTDSYDFMVILNVAFFAVAGFIGLGVLRGALWTLFATPPVPSSADSPLAPPVAPVAPVASPTPELPIGPVVVSPRLAPLDDQPEPLFRRPSASFAVFRVWILIYVVVGAQMSWILRPFIGNPNEPFTLFRSRDSHFFEALFATIRRLLS